MKKKDYISSFVNIFSKTLPNKYILFIVLLFASITIGIINIAIINHKFIMQDLFYILITGSLAGLIAISIPSLFTISILKLIKRRIMLKHIFFLSLISLFIYSIFFILAAIIYIFTNAYIASIAIILGNILIFSEWFFITKIILGLKKKAIIVSLVQPTLNLLLYIPASNFLFKLSIPIKLLMIKFYFGVFIFILISYLILYLFDKPMKRSLGFNTMEVFSQMLQNWMFDINIPNIFGEKFGEYKNVEVNTIIFKNKKNITKAIFFIPDIHYGPFSTIGGSNFPYLLESYGNKKYKTPIFIMHSTVNEDSNPVNSLQINKLKEAMDNALQNGNLIKNDKISFFKASINYSNLIAIDFNRTALISFSRAPKVTEDISSEVQEAFKNRLSSKFTNPILLDAHNSRYETASQTELNGVQLNSIYYKEYLAAINMLKQVHKNKIKLGISSIEFYNALNKPKDLAPGNLNTAIFSFNKFKFAIILINANNMSPLIHKQITDYAHQKYKISAEVYTTDTHYVNSMAESARNVFGNYTNFNSFKDLLDKAILAAVNNIEDVKCYYNKDEIKKFLVWGSNIREKVFTVINSIFSTAKILIPLFIIFGLIISIWIISYI